MEKSLRYRGILSVGESCVCLTNAGNTELNDAIRKMLGTDGECDIPCELVITVNRYDDCFEINGEKFEVSKGE